MTMAPVLTNAEILKAIRAEQGAGIGNVATNPNVDPKPTTRQRGDPPSEAALAAAQAVLDAAAGDPDDDEGPSGEDAAQAAALAAAAALGDETEGDPDGEGEEPETPAPAEPPARRPRRTRAAAPVLDQAAMQAAIQEALAGALTPLQMQLAQTAAELQQAKAQLAQRPALDPGVYQTLRQLWDAEQGRQERDRQRMLEEMTDSEKVEFYEKERADAIARQQAEWQQQQQQQAQAQLQAQQAQAEAAQRAAQQRQQAAEQPANDAQAMAQQWRIFDSTLKESVLTVAATFGVTEADAMKDIRSAEAKVTRDANGRLASVDFGPAIKAATAKWEQQDGARTTGRARARALGDGRGPSGGAPNGKPDLYDTKYNNGRMSDGVREAMRYAALAGEKF